MQSRLGCLAPEKLCYSHNHSDDLYSRTPVVLRGRQVLLLSVPPSKSSGYERERSDAQAESQACSMLLRHLARTYVPYLVCRPGIVALLTYNETFEYRLLAGQTE